MKTVKEVTLTSVKGKKFGGGRMKLMHRESIFKIFALCLALLVDAEACVTRKFSFSCNAFLSAYSFELEVSVCGARSCTVALCHIQTEISVRLFDKGTVWEVMHVGLVNLISFDYRNHIFWKWPLCPPSGGVDMRYIHRGHLLELLSYPDRVIHFTSYPTEEGKFLSRSLCVQSSENHYLSTIGYTFFFFCITW